MHPRRIRDAKRRTDRGSGAAIGVCVMFPFLMGMIVAIQMMAASSRIEYSLQSLADRAAQTASLCCYYTDDAEATARATLAANVSDAVFGQDSCANDIVVDATIGFVDVDGAAVTVTTAPPHNPVPPVAPCT